MYLTSILLKERQLNFYLFWGCCFFAHSPISMSICWSPSDPSRFCCSSAFPDTWRRPTTVWPRLFVCGHGLPESNFFHGLFWYNPIIIFIKNHKHIWYRLWFIKFYCHDNVSSWFPMIFPYMIMFQHAHCVPLPVDENALRAACCKDMGGSTLKVATSIHSK